MTTRIGRGLATMSPARERRILKADHDRHVDGIRTELTRFGGVATLVQTHRERQERPVAVKAHTRNGRPVRAHRRRRATRRMS